LKTELKSTRALQTGDRLTRDEFMDRWEALPNIKFAELIGGIVYVSPPMSSEHGDVHMPLSGWLWAYQAATPGCKGNSASTWYMRDDAPQPENSLRILPEYGGKSTLLMRNGRNYLVGAPELAAEIALSSRGYDLKVKKELYRKSGVQEFLCVQPEKTRVAWLRLKSSDYAELKSRDGILRSEVFPGLWLDAKALLMDDEARLLQVLREGLSTPEHAAFVAKLAARKAALPEK
jgi:Uma2 family endonuclease